jgi:Farnesoic acid 0-methyl transferase.
VLPSLLELHGVHIALICPLDWGFAGFWSETEVVLAGADIATADSLQYIYRPMSAGALHFEVRAPSNAHIALTSASHETEPMYEILLGGWENTASVIRYNRQKPDKVHNSCYIVLCQAEQKEVSRSLTVPVRLSQHERKLALVFNLWVKCRSRECKNESQGCFIASY